jgi:hypothetical protein
MIDRALERLAPPTPWMHFQAPLNEETITLSVPEAMTAVVVASVWADGVKSGEESARLTDMLSTSRVVRHAAQNAAEPVTRATMLLTNYGRAPVLAACAAAIPPDMRATAFANAVDLVFADGHVDEREKTYVDDLAGILGIEETLALKIIEVLAIKGRT